MKLNRLETHDRLQYFLKDQWEVVSQGAQNCLKENPDSLAIQQKCPYVYLFAHPRTADDGVTKRLLWQPRISRPKPQTNSYLFRARSNTDIIEVCWLIPSSEMWAQYQPGKVTEDNITMWSINQFKYHPDDLAQPHPDDLSEERAKQVFSEVHAWKRFKKI
jgi:hypothetical protein